MASSLKGKIPATQARDWRYWIDYEEGNTLQMQMQLSVLRCTFYLTPERRVDSIPSEHMQGLTFIENMEEPTSVPWTGYYAPYKMAWIAVANGYGVWFEIGRVHGWFMAIRPARQSLHLSNWPADGINMKLLTETGEPIPASRAPSQQPETYVDEPHTSIEPLSSLMQWGRGGGGWHPQGTGDDPAGIDDLNQDEPSKSKSKWLEGVTPTKFNGNQSKSPSFLSEFKRFMRMNHDANIAKDPFKKCNYFLSLMEGPDTEGWVMMQDDWLKEVIEDKSNIPWQMDEWQIMEQEFKKAFVDYAEHEKANDELRKLRMKDGNIDAYIARFTQLAHWGGHNADEPELLWLFIQGVTY